MSGHGEAMPPAQVAGGRPRSAVGSATADHPDGPHASARDGLTGRDDQPQRLGTRSQADDQRAGVVDHPPRQADQPWVRGGEADSRNFANISIVYKGQIRGVCLSRGGCRGQLLHQEDLLRR